MSDKGNSVKAGSRSSQLPVVAGGEFPSLGVFFAGYELKGPKLEGE